MTSARQTTNNIKPTTNSTGGPACLGSCRGRTDFRLMVEPYNRSKHRSVRRVARASALAFGGAAKTEPTAHGGAGAERQTIPHEHQRPGLTRRTATVLGNPQAGAGKQLTTQHTKTAGCTGPDRGPVHTRYTPNLAFQRIHWAPRNEQFAARFERVSSDIESPCVQQHDERTRSGLRRSLCFGSSSNLDGNYPFPLFQYGFSDHQTPLASPDFFKAVRVAHPLASNRLATRLPGSNSGMEEERRCAFSERTCRFCTDRRSHRTGTAQHVFLTECSRFVRGVSLRTPLGFFFSRDSGLSPRGSRSFLDRLPVCLQTSLITRELKRSVYGCHGVAVQHSFRITCREVDSTRVTPAKSTARGQDE